MKNEPDVHEMAEHVRVRLSAHDKAVTLTQEQYDALASMLDDRIWWDATIRRVRRFSFVFAIVLGGLVGLATWWPWISRVVQAIIKDVPPAN